MGRVQGGDETALGALMERWEVPLKSFIGRIVLNAGEAEELAQETFVRVWQQREKFRADAEFRPWVFAIAVNLARNRLRWWRRRPVVSLEGWDETQKAEGGGRSAVRHWEQMVVHSPGEDRLRVKGVDQIDALIERLVAEAVGAMKDDVLRTGA